jgi:hypothetical protein
VGLQSRSPVIASEAKQSGEKQRHCEGWIPEAIQKNTRHCEDEVRSNPGKKNKEYKLIYEHSFNF